MTLAYGKVTFRAQEIIADTPFDLDALPDVRPITGYVDFIPSRATNFDKGSGALVVMQTVTAGLDSQGVLRDGQGNQNVTLVSPLSPDLLHRDWTWTARFRVTGGQVGPYVFNLAVGQTKNLADESKLLSLTIEIVKTTVVDNGDGTAVLTGETISDAGDGTFTVNDPALADNGDGTYSLTA